jgi:hypothetical protein
VQLLCANPGFGTQANRAAARWDVHVAEVLGGGAEGSYEQEAAVVEEEHEEMERLECMRASGARCRAAALPLPRGTGLSPCKGN